MKSGEHWWGIQYNGAYPNCIAPVVPIPFSSYTSTGVWGGYINNSGVLTPYMGTGIAIVNVRGITYSGFPNNSCIKITHYVKCCGEMKRQTAMITIGTSNMKMADGKIANIVMGEVEIIK